MSDRNEKPANDVSATDSMLLRAALNNDQSAWCRLVKTYGSLVYRWARNEGLQSCDAAEITNQVFTSVARALPEFHHSRALDTFRGWLRRITQNAIADWARAQRRQPFQAAGGSANQELLLEQLIVKDLSSMRQPEPSQEQAAVEKVRIIAHPKAWRIFWLVTAEGMSPGEVAAECGVSVNVVYLTKHRLSKEIRQQLSTGSAQGESPQGLGCSNGNNRSMS